MYICILDELREVCASLLLQHGHEHRAEVFLFILFIFLDSIARKNINNNKAISSTQL
jgi:hypothetical protein